GGDGAAERDRIGAVVPERVHLARRDGDDVARPCEEPVAPGLHRGVAVDDLEGLGLVRVDVRHGHAAAGGEDDLDQGVCAAGLGSGLDERDRLTGDLVHERLSWSNHFANLLHVRWASRALVRSGSSISARPSSSPGKSVASWGTPKVVPTLIRMDELGLFPLGIVLLPTERVPLHIFEPRYRELIGECLEEDRELGLVYGDADGMQDTGNSARVAAILERFDYGRLNIVVVGGSRFVVERL